MATLANTVPVTNVYPTYEGGMISLGPSGTTPSSATPASTGAQSSAAASNPVDNALMGGASGEPVVWWLAMVVLLLGLMYGAQKLGADGDFSNLKMSAYNIFVISIAAIIGINLFKLLFTKFPVPGLSTVVLSE